jgi:hypothetical protein
LRSTVKAPYRPGMDRRHFLLTSLAGVVARPSASTEVFIRPSNPSRNTRTLDYANIAAKKARIMLNVMIARVLTLVIISFPFFIHVKRQASPISI